MKLTTLMSWLVVFVLPGLVNLNRSSDGIIHVEVISSRSIRWVIGVVPPAPTYVVLPASRANSIARTALPRKMILLWILWDLLASPYCCAGNDPTGPG